MNRLKLLIVLDTLLREGSVGAAAQSLGVHTSAVSRMLSDLRDHFGDPILTRTGKGMRPTALAESLRLPVRSLADDAERLLAGHRHPERAARPGTPDAGWQRITRTGAPPLAVTTRESLAGSPTPEHIARRLAAIDGTADPHRRLAKYIALTAPGPGRSRPLAEEEARDALGIILAGAADPMQVGALLFTMQYRGLTAPELAGFVRAIRDHMTLAPGDGPRPDLDWPAYLSARWRMAPWFIHSARLVAASGRRVLLHGYCGDGPESGKIEAAAEDAGIPVCLSGAELARAFRQGAIAYLPLGAFAPQVQSLLAAYPLFEMRSPLNRAVPVLNPLGAPATVLGAAESAQRDLYRVVADLLGVGQIAIVGGNRDFAQVPAGRALTLLRLVDGTAIDTPVGSRPVSQEAIPRGYTQREYWQAVWSGAVEDDGAVDSILHTAAVALLCLAGDPAAGFPDALAEAGRLWRIRQR